MKHQLCEKVAEVGIVSGRVMAFVSVFVDDVVMLICGYAPQCTRHLEEGKLKGE